MRAPRHAGFTLVEVLVALGILALMAGMGWRALGGMVDATRHTQAHTDAVLTLDAALGQWNADLDALAELPMTTALDWNAQVLRMTRRPAVDAGAGAVVVAWTRGERQGQSQWLRWQSAPVRSRQQWTQAWAAAAQWAQSPSETLRAQEVVLGPLQGWQIFYFRGGTWSNPLSSAGTSSETAKTGTGSTAPLPDGVRLILEVPTPHPLAGTLTRDWARPVTLLGAP
ncbi:MAG: prepilin-type N-terminal cleavage/methylation domain-containing protein [Rhodoferax sp.]|nr:MAG: prepilin-type N-terminal cleavage/methylation domain-containing protein [Rhodoferax sp.]